MNINKKLVKIILIFCFVILFINLLNNKYKNNFENNQNKVLFLKGAKSAIEKKNGLMFVKKLKQNHGMLFEYDYYGNHTMWMKNTIISLDILFLNKNNILLGYIENTTPLSLKSLGINKHSKKIIEVASGTIKKNNFQIGDKIKYNLI